MSFNLPADFTKKMLWGLLPFMTGFMMLSQRANLARSNIAGRYYMRLVLPVMALLVFIGSAGAQSLPEPLGAADVIQYKRLIELQKNGNMKQAIREMGRLKDPVLKGHLLAQRYLHPTAWRSSYKELSSWLAAYNDHPDASRIYWLAKRRKPKNARSPKAPKPGYLNGYGQAGAHGYRPRIPASNAGRASPTRTASIARSIRRAIRRGWPSGALDIVNDPQNKRYLTAAEEGQLRGEIAHAYFIFGVDSKAIRQARYAIGIGREYAQLAYWAGGLASWRSGQIDRCRPVFPDACQSCRSQSG